MNPGNQDNQIESVEKTTENLVFHKYLPYTIGYLFILIIFTVYYSFLPVPHDFRVYAIPLALGVVAYVYVKGKVKTEFTKQFGVSIGFSYEPKGEIGVGKLFSIGTGQSVYDVLSGVYNGRKSRIFSYKYTVGTGKSSHTDYFTVFEVTLNAVMPDIMVYSRAGGLLMPVVPSDSESIELEGDFNKYFTLKVPKGYEVEAYQVFSPNVMEDLVDKAQKLNFEFSGNKLYIYVTKLVTVRSDLLQMFDLAKYLDDLFARSTRDINISSQPVGDAVNVLPSSDAKV